jgi:V8-like Glu-specific endopeptidase
MTRVARRAALISVTGVLIATAAASTTAAAESTGHATARRPHVPTVSGHAAAITAGQQAGVRRYWTRARMEHAVTLGPGGRPAIGAAAGQPARERTWQAARERTWQAATATGATSGALWTGGGAVARTTGKVFFSLGGHDYVCSGSTVTSANADVVVTAAHCVDNPGGAWATNWTFVPGYSDGNSPYGSYTARRFYVASQWSTGGDNDDDVAFVVVNPATVRGNQVSVVQEVGGQGIAFGGQPAQETAFGYPADSPYNGQQLYYCSGTVRPDPYQQTTDNGLTCVMTEGSSGGPWLAGFSPATGTGTITSVSSFKYSTDSQILYGTPFGSVAQSLYMTAQNA